MITQTSEDTQLTRPELALRWKLSIETIKRREKSGQLRCIKNGRAVRFRMCDILEFEKGALTK